jgi:hypothetical protein
MFAQAFREARNALAEEERHRRAVSFTVCLDGALIRSTEQWAHDIRRVRHIGAFPLEGTRSLCTALDWLLLEVEARLASDG